MHRRHLVDHQLDTDSANPEPASSSSLHPATSTPTNSSSCPLNFLPGSDSESDIVLDHPYGSNLDEVEDNERSLEPPPPSYEQSIATSSTSSSTTSSSSRTQQQRQSRSNPFLQSTNDDRAFTRAPPSHHQRRQMSTSNQDMFVPIIAPRHSPSAPPLNLLASTSSNNNTHHSSSRGGQSNSMRTSRTLDDLNSTTANTITSSSLDSTTNNREQRSSTSRGKRPISNRHKVISTDSDYDNNHINDIDNDVESVAFGVQSAISPSYMHPSATSSSTSVTSSQQQVDQDYYFHPQNSTSSAQLRTARRLQHKQAHARHAASAPNLYPPQPQPHEVSAARAAAVAQALSAPRVPLSQSVIPAPPPRLLQFRSREPSSVPACPFLLCQKPITYTKTRSERGVTVWIICGLLFLCNTYWTTQSLISHFSTPNRERVYSQDTTDTFANSAFSAKGEARHLVKGFLGFKTHRYKDPQFKNYQRHQSALKRPTIATVGVVQDDTSVLRAILSFGLLALMAIIRWWMCLTPLLIRPLFDTVHSCPHPHPYPFPEELEQERREKEEEERREEEEFQRQLARQQQRLQEGSPWTNWYGGDEKQRLGERDEVERAPVGTEAVTNTLGDDSSRDTKGASKPNNSSNNNNPSTGRRESQEPPTSSTLQAGTSAGDEEEDVDNNKDKKSQKGGRFRFFRRFHAARQQRTEQGKQVLVTTMIQIKKKQLSWRGRRELKKKEEKRKAIIKASQDIGRFSLLFQLGSFFLLDRWGQSTVVGPGMKTQR